jgi:predicted Zn-dependent protease with MMP-like domain
MFIVSQEQFEKLVEDGINAIPKPFIDKIDNIAFLVEDEPSQEQRRQLGLRCNQTLFGLYEGVPLPQRMGAVKIMPDKITIFKKPIEHYAHNLDDVKKQVIHTVWHEVAHYFGLDHDRIHELERNRKK